MPSILHVSQPVEAGVAKWVADIARYQTAAGWSVSVACPAGNPQIDSLSDEVRAAGAEWRQWEATREPGRGVLSEHRRLGSIVAATNPDIVHLHSAKAGLVGRLVLRGRRPTIFQPHAWSFHAAKGKLKRASQFWERSSARWADAIVCVSAGERAEGERAGIRGRYVVIPNGVDLAQLRMLHGSDRTDARARLGLGSAPLAVCIGRLAEQKGQDILLDAWPRVRAALPDASVALVGAGPTEGALRARRTAGAMFIGASLNPEDWYAAADVLVMPSRWEGMSFVLLEALAYGRSVVAFDVAGVRDVLGIESDQIVSAGDGSALADAIVMRLQDPGLAAAEGRAGRRLISNSHDLKATMASMDDVYVRVLQPRSTAARRSSPSSA